MLHRSVAGAAVLLGVIVLWLPLTSLLFGNVNPTESSGFNGATLNDPSTLFVRTMVWSLGVGLASLLLGWLPGYMLGASIQSARSSNGRGSQARLYMLLVLILLPLLVPNYAIFYAWWQTWPSGSWLFNQLQAIDSIGIGRQATLGIALVSWSWPLVSLCVVPAAATWPQARSDQLKTDGAGWWQGILMHWNHERGGLLLGLLLVTVLVFGNIISFDLAGVFTVGNELRALTAVNAPVSEMFWLILPATILAIAGAATAWWAVGRRVDDASPGNGRLSGRAWLLAGCLWVVTACVPMLLIVSNLDTGFAELWRSHGRALLRDASRCLVCCVLVFVVYLGLILLLRSMRRWLRVIAVIWSILWIACLLVPGSLVASAVIGLVNYIPGTGFRGWLLTSGGALQIAWLAKYGGLAALSARWIVGSEPVVLRDVARMQGASWSADGPRTWLMGVGVAMITFLFAMGEIPISMRLSPPSSSPPVSVTLLNAMHYQRPATVIAVLALLLFIGWIVAVLIAILARVMHRYQIQSMILLVMLLVPTFMIAGCSDPASESDRLVVDRVIGGPGRSAGSFDYPRAMAVDARTGDIYTVEKTGRVQRLNKDGHPLESWQMPAIDKGRPTGMSVSDDGRIWIADTHEHRIMIYNQNGTLVDKFGEYGTGPGQFIYPTDIAFGFDDQIYVSEYGGNDRIQVFSMDGEWRDTIGSPGALKGQFDRPQSMAMSSDGTQLFVADARNRRIQRIDLESHMVEVVHQGGIDGPIQIPFGIAVASNGDLLVSDTGSHQCVRLDDAGFVIDQAGGWGWGDGQLRDPWSIICTDQRILVLDSGNNRVLSMNVKNTVRP